MKDMPKILDLGYFVLIWEWSKLIIYTRNHEADVPEPIYLNRTANCLIIGFDNIFNIEVN